MRKYILIFVIFLSSVSTNLNAQQFQSETDVLIYLDGKTFTNTSVNANLRFSNSGGTLTINGRLVFYNPDIKVLSTTKALYTFYSTTNPSTKIGGIINSQFNTITDRSNGRIYKMQGGEDQEYIKKRIANSPNHWDKKLDQKIKLGDYLKLSNKKLKLPESGCHISYYNGGQFSDKSEYFKGYVLNAELFDNDSILVGELKENADYIFLEYEKEQKRIYGKKTDFYNIGLQERGFDVGFYNIGKDEPMPYPSKSYVIKSDDPPGCMIISLGEMVTETSDEYNKKKRDEIKRKRDIEINKFLVKRISEPKQNPIKDINGNLYGTTSIAGQTWMSDNLNVVTYRNGDSIPQITDRHKWEEATTGAWSYYDNDSTNGKFYGKLYNWYAINDPRGLAPLGWHIPTKLECYNLTTNTAAKDNDIIFSLKLPSIGLKLKAPLWEYLSQDATNSSGFSALPTGERYSFGAFGETGIFFIMWTSSSSFDGNENGVNKTSPIYYNFTIDRRSQSEEISISYVRNPNTGYSVRCVKDN